MARILIVGCGCRGQHLAKGLCAEGHQVRGTTRDPLNYPKIEAAGAEAVFADPNSLMTLTPALADVTVVVWLLGSASGDKALVADLHGPRLERLLESVVDTPVRGFVYEASGSVPGDVLESGAGLAETAARTWMIPVEVVCTPAETDCEALLESVHRAVRRLLASTLL